MTNLKLFGGLMLIVAVILGTCYGAAELCKATHLLLVLVLAPVNLIVIFVTGFAVADWVDAD